MDIQGYKQKNAFIVAQSPMEKTIRDFWRMVFNLKCATIVMLCEFTENGRVSSTQSLHRAIPKYIL